MTAISEASKKSTLNTPQKLMDSMVSFVQKTYDPTGIILPMWTLVDKDGGVYIYMTPFTDDADREHASMMIRAAVQKHDAVMLGFMSETWLASMPSGTKEEDLKHIIPSEQPNRQETIYMVVETASGQGNISGHILIEREAHDKATLKPFEQHPADTKFGGRFANMFPKATVN